MSRADQCTSERKQADGASESPDDVGSLSFENLFDLHEIQQLQDEFAKASGVASLVARPDGTPITTPSNFCRFCRDIIGETEKGRVNCYNSDAAVGVYRLGGPTIQPCIGAGLWIAGAGIAVEGRHIANWLIGQVRDGTQKEEEIRAYAREIGTNEDKTVEAFRDVPSMSRQEFEKISQILFTFSRELSNAAYQKLQLKNIVEKRLQAEAALADSQYLLQTVIDTLPIRVSWKDRNLFYLGCNPAFAEDAGKAHPSEVIGKDDHHMVWADRADLYRASDREVMESGTPRLWYEEQMTTSSGQTIWQTKSKVPLKNRGNETIGILCIYQDNTEHKTAQQELRASEERYRSLFAHMRTGFTLREIITDEAGRPVDCRFLAVNEAFLARRGFRSEDVVGKTLTEIYPDTARDPTDWIAIFGEVALTGKAVHFEAFGVASQQWMEVTAYQTAPRQFAVLLNDISERKQAEQKIQELAYFDGLTKLPNRRLLIDRLGQALIAGARSKRKGGLLFVDLDDFKTLNDTFGHGEGDLLLQQVAQRLTSSVREGDTVARLGGDEFVVMLEDLSENPPDAAAQIKIVGEKILAALNQPYVVSSQEHHSTASIGAALFGETRDSLDDLLKRADIAMYQAKSAGRNTLRFFDPALQAAVKARAVMEEALRQAINRGEFLLYYQPQVDRGSLIGAEALIRWKHPKRGMVLPGEFIPLAEETGLILPLGRWVLETACGQIAAWAGRKETRHFNIAVNVSARQFRQADFVDQVLRVLERTTADPHNLKLELTESMLVDNVEDVIAKMTALKSRGLSFSLDDFGTGYSSLSYLKRLPLDQLKIDQSFVRDVLADLNNGAIAQTIIALSQTMGLSVIAEGVETEEQRDFLARLGCPAFQGFLFSRPVPVEELEWLMNGPPASERPRGAL
jgi:diguanylate cyclase (GGDEF)-like protein/PAS domain S-box-containing protein